VEQTADAGTVAGRRDRELNDFVPPGHGASSGYDDFTSVSLPPEHLMQFSLTQNDLHPP
jgi:hypothetical protein